jgi:hypothetical protein
MIAMKPTAMTEGPEAFTNSRFHHRPSPDHKPHSKLETAYYKADQAIEDIVRLLAP